MASPLPLLLAGGAALLLLSGKKKVKKIVAIADDVHEPLPSGDATAPPTPKPKPEPSKPSEEYEIVDPLVIEEMLFDLGYDPGSIDGGLDSDTSIAIEEFQKDWNSLMEWLWAYNPNVSKDSPNYGKITVDGLWGKNTQKRAIRAMEHFQDPSGSYITIDEQKYPVKNFREMVIQAWTVKPV